MLRILFHLLVSAVYFVYILPHVSGAHFDGGLSEGLTYGILMGLVAIILRLLTGIFEVGTLGLGLIPVFLIKHFIPWLIAVVELFLLARWFPAHLSFDNGFSVLVAGVVFWFFNWVLQRVL